MARTRLPHQRLLVLREIGPQESGDRRADALDDRAQVPRLVFRPPAQLLDRRGDGAALGVAEHDDKAHVKALGGELHAADLRRRDDVAGDADDEQIPEALVEDEFGRHARVRAAEDDGEWLLAAGDFLAPRVTGRGLQASGFRDESSVPLPKPLESLQRWNHGG